jgi:16S rRNA (uracil1498-N3)-methyltransferase
MFDEKPICILVGPEGDFSEEEREKILKYEKVFVPIKINDNILRSETAAISSLSIVNYAIS